MRKFLKQNQGITLIALVITIIVLLILAGISISTLTGNNGVLQKTIEAKKNTSIGGEKENIVFAWNSLISKKILNGYEITDLMMENELNNNGADTMVGYDDNNNYLVHFNDSNRTYLVTKDGNITQIENVSSIVTETIYVTLYSDGTFAFSNNSETDSTKTIIKKYTVGKDDLYDTQDMVPWKNETNNVEKVIFLNEIRPTSTRRWFRECVNLHIIENIENLNTSQVRDMSYMFFNCSSLTNINLSSFDTKRVTKMASVFENCYELLSIDFSNFNTSRVTIMSWMFYQCKKLRELNLSSFNTENVTTMKGMFARCFDLANLNISSFNTKNVTEMQSLLHFPY